MIVVVICEVFSWLVDWMLLVEFGVYVIGIVLVVFVNYFGYCYIIFVSDKFVLDGVF